MGSATSYTVSFRPINALSKMSTIKIYIPAQVQKKPSLSLNCSSKYLPKNLSCTFDQASRQLIVKTNLQKPLQLPFKDSLAIEFYGFRSPSQSNLNESFQIRTYDGDGNGMDQRLKNLGTTFKCNDPCKTCAITRDSCTSCSAGLEKYLYRRKCLRSCPAGTYGRLTNASVASSGYQCYKCDAECNTCNGTSSFCTRCNSSKYVLFPKIGRCKDKCPDGQYTDVTTSQCVKCDAKCSKCTSKTVCTACNGGFLYYSTTCRKTCPLNMIPSPDNTFCVNC